jgi:hypothetical protein
LGPGGLLLLGQSGKASGRTRSVSQGSRKRQSWRKGLPGWGAQRTQQAVFGGGVWGEGKS